MTEDYPPIYGERLSPSPPHAWNLLIGDDVSPVVKWSQALQPPVFPREKINLQRAEHGRIIWKEQCANCHAADGKRLGRVTSITELGTDPARHDDGYVNAPLDGLWVRAPYLHNGSVPTLQDLLLPGEQRPEVFFRGYDVFDWARVGYVSSGPEAEKAGFRYDTRLRGNHNTGHEYGTALSQSDKEDLLEYLKTF